MSFEKIHCRLRGKKRGEEQSVMDPLYTITYTQRTHTHTRKHTSCSTKNNFEDTMRSARESEAARAALASRLREADDEKDTLRKEIFGLKLEVEKKILKKLQSLTFSFKFLIICCVYICSYDVLHYEISIHVLKRYHCCFLKKKDCRCKGCCFCCRR